MNIIGLIAMERHYGVDRTLVKRTMAEGDGFPYSRNGTTYVFDKEEVDAWLEAHGGWARGLGATDSNKSVRDLPLPDAHLHAPKIPMSIQKLQAKTAMKADKSHVQTQLLQLELDKKRGNLVPRDDIINEFAPAMANIAKGMELIPNLIGKRHGLSDDVIRDIRDQMDQLRLGLVRMAKTGIMADDYVLKEEEE